MVTGKSFTIDAHKVGGIEGNGQTWWSYYSANNITRRDGDGRPIALSVVNATHGVVRDFRIEAQPFWCNTVAQSKDITYDGMYCNATNTDARFAGQKYVYRWASSTSFSRQRKLIVFIVSCLIQMVNLLLPALWRRLMCIRHQHVPFGRGQAVELGCRCHGQRTHATP